MTIARRRNLLVALCVVLVIVTLYVLDFQPTAFDGSFTPNTSEIPPLPPASQPISEFPDPETRPSRREYSKTLVVASTRKEDTSWVKTGLRDMQHAIYVADDTEAEFHPPKNKGHETMMYLTYIIDHYHNLSDITIFTHSERNAWHNNDLFEFDLVRMVGAISGEHVERVGYFNLRCHHESGCPDHIKPHDYSRNTDKQEQPYFHQVWDALHGPNAPPLPETLAVACCSQFAASKGAILNIPLERWLHYRQWIIDSKLSDSITGRIWEWTWHYVLTGKEVICPPVEYCYCDGYGLCFRDGGEIQSWLAMKEVQLLAKYVKADFADGNTKAKDDVQFHLDQRIGRPLNKWLYEAELRGKDPKTRALLSGRGDTWVLGDGY